MTNLQNSLPDGVVPPAVLQRQPTYNGGAPVKHQDDMPTGLWFKCKHCEQIFYQNLLDENLQVCPNCGFHYPLPARERIKQLTDTDSFQEINAGLISFDVLDFAGGGIYSRKLEETRNKTNLPEAVITGLASLEGEQFALAVMDFSFMGASMGSAVGEKVTRCIEAATERLLPVVLVTASGGARMQEGALSLMQMAKTSAALMKHDQARLTSINILTHPTTGGVTASFASLGDIILAEPQALVGFAGPRVIEQTTKAQLPEGFQSAEYLLKHGLLDRIVERKNLRRELANLLKFIKH